MRLNQPCGAPPPLLRERLTRLTFLAAFSAAFGVAAAFAQAPATAPPAPALDYEVQIEAPEPIAALLRDNLGIEHWHGRERMDAGQLKRLFEEGKQEAATFLATAGYYSPDIDATLEQAGARWIARYRVAPNRATRVTAVRIRFSGAIAAAPPGDEPAMATLRTEWLLPAGAVFQQGEWERAKRKLLQTMLIFRYPGATLTGSRAEVDVPAATAVLEVDIDSGAEVTFGELHVQGIARYPESVVLNLNPIKPGEPYSQERLFEFQRRLQDSGYFQRADVNAEAAPGGSVAPVTVTLVEALLQKVAFGVGYSTNTGYRGQVNYDRLDLFGSAVHLRSALVLETRRQSGLVDFLFPVTAQGYRDSISNLVQREDVQNEIVRTAGITGKRAWGPLELERSVTLGYLRERKDVAGDVSASGQSVTINYGITLRRTDNLLSPTRGYLLNLQAGAAPTPILTTTQFGRLYGKYVGYFPLGASNTFILRGEGGYVLAKTRVGIPDDFLFRAGGDQSIRGYGYQELGVRQGDAVVGGRYLAVASAEVVHWLAPGYPNWGVAAFVDAGNAADKPANLEPVYGYGVGARWKSPVGVVNVDVAYGQQVRQARLHFSLGVSF